MANLTSEQFQQLLTTMTKTAIEAAVTATSKQAVEGNAASNAAIQRNDPSALGPMRQCVLGDDKMRKLTIFDDWLEEAESRMEYIGSTSDKEKVILLRTWGGQDIKELIKRQTSIVGKKSAKIKKEDTDTDIPELETATSDQAESKAETGGYQDTIDRIR